MAWIYITYGRPGQGKSLDQARIARSLFNSYYRQEKHYPKLPKRTLWSNQKFSKKIEEKELVDFKKSKAIEITKNGEKDIVVGQIPVKNGGHLRYWTSPRQLKTLRDSDILWDEIGKDLPADSWKETPKWLRQVFSHHRKRGNRIFGNTQDYVALDINVRRMVTKAFTIRKMWGTRDISVSLPPIKRPWAVMVKREFDPVQIELVKDVAKLEPRGWPRLIFAGRKLIEFYDTTQELPAYQPDKMEEIVLECEHGPDCTDPKHRFSIRHRPI